MSYVWFFLGALAIAAGAYTVICLLVLLMLRRGITGFRIDQHGIHAIRDTS